MRQQRRVGGDDDDDRALLRCGIGRTAASFVAARPGESGWQRLAVRDAAGEVGYFFANRNAGDSQIAAQSVVALHQYTDGVTAVFRRQLPGRGADAALETMA